MNITLSPEVERRVEELVQRGTYPSANALVEDALGAFLDIEGQEDLDSLRQRLAVAEAEIDRGEFVEYGAENVQELVKDIQVRGLRRLKQLNATKSKK